MGSIIFIFGLCRSLKWSGAIQFTVSRPFKMNLKNFRRIHQSISEIGNIHPFRLYDQFPDKTTIGAQGRIPTFRRHRQASSSWPHDIIRFNSEAREVLLSAPTTKVEYTYLSSPYHYNYFLDGLWSAVLSCAEYRQLSPRQLSCPTILLQTTAQRTERLYQFDFSTKCLWL